jgi:integrase
MRDGGGEPRLKLYRGRWYAVWSEAGETKRRALRTADRRAALAALAAFAAAGPRPEEIATVADAWIRYRTEKGTPRAAWAWLRLAPHFAHLAPAAVTPASCRAYGRARARAGATDGTIWTELTFLRAALRYAHLCPPAEVALPPKPPPRDRYMTREQYARVLAACETPHLRVFCALALATGGRSGAILELTWDRVDFERGLIRLGLGEQRRKGRATVPMTESLRLALEAAHEARTSPYVIEYAGGQVASVKGALRRAAARAGLDWVTPHVFRHTAAVWMAEAGVTMPEIAAFLGHTDSRITERVYARFSPDYLRRAARALEA